VSDDLGYRVASARELVMITDELLMVRGFTDGCWRRYFFYVT